MRISYRQAFSPGHPQRVRDTITLMQAPTAYHSFFDGLLDYAGLFPPAELPMLEALQEYASAAQGPHCFALSHFIVPHTRLQELSERAAQLQLGTLSLSVLCPELAQYAQEIQNFFARHTSTFELAALETRINTSDDIRSHIQAAVQSWQPWQNESLIPKIFFEIPWQDFQDQEYEKQIAACFANLADYREKTKLPLCAKLRCGGKFATDFPSTRVIVSFLLASKKYALPLKCTAGLHQAFPKYDKEIGVQFHGYWNIFWAACLVEKGEDNLELLCQYLEAKHEELPFARQDSVTFFGREVSLQDIKNARQNIFLSFGTCSFAEPVEDARQRGWIE